MMGQRHARCQSALSQVRVGGFKDRQDKMFSQLEEGPKSGRSRSKDHHCVPYIVSLCSTARVPSLVVAGLKSRVRSVATAC